MEMEFVFEKESDVSNFIYEKLKEEAQNYESVEFFLRTLPEKVWQALLLTYECVIRDELQSLLADALTEEEESV